MTSMTIDAFYSEPSVIGTKPIGASWSEDSRTLTFLWSDKGARARDLWSWSDGELTRLTDITDEDTPAGLSEALLAADGTPLVILAGKLYRVEGGTLRPVAADLANISNLARSPDGRTVAFVSDGALYALGAADAAPTLLLGAEPLLYIESFAFAPDGRTIAAVQADDRKVRRIEIAYDAGGEARVDHHTRAFPGDALTERRLAVIPVAGGAPAWFDRADNEDAIWDYGISPDGATLMVSSSDLSIKHHTIYTFDIAGGTRTEAYTAHDPVKIRPDWRCAYAPGGTLLLTTDAPRGFNHLHRLAAPGAELEPLTSGEWEVEDFAVAPDGAIYLTSNAAHPAERQIMRLENGALTPVTSAPGLHVPTYAPDFSKAADLYSNDAAPHELFMQPLPEGEAVRLTHSPQDGFDGLPWASVTYLPYTSRIDGAELMARITLPADHDPARRYPLVVGSNYSDALLNQWGGRAAHPSWGLDQVLSARGFIVVQPEIRGSFGRGRDWNAPMLHSYGAQDIDDIADCVASLVERGLVDETRVGIWGSSYGGLMAMMSLAKKPGTYACGIAGAPATNVFHAYPEQEWIMGPHHGTDFPARFEAQSAYWQVDTLEDPLMIVHGTKDEVVLYSDTIAVMEKLIDGNKDVELVTLPGAAHGWDNEGLPQTRFAYTKMIAFLERHLK
ncbi:prolyl oligopeptidase family serine peptidase [Roseicyclus sp. F158]|uniref:Prolyl oligopeptidase family serine peptidase n=1 Tax=Tropicimonas omnivorans TaxID=3075590 RepID=A0ABU3DLC4_9RHOB|nr:prolyl oligopeptidase family serine peptidase [Roseicyclus sp. F158]MDT0684497.1 prolyl oligopeptidase family serine peptidase [Roseicyclus sp. F158]